LLSKHEGQVDTLPEKKGNNVRRVQQISFPEVPLGGNQFVFQFRKGARYPDRLLPRFEESAGRQVHRWIGLVGAGQFIQSGF
jgi:hypothetical protein